MFNFRKRTARARGVRWGLGPRPVSVRCRYVYILVYLYVLQACVVLHRVGLESVAGPAFVHTIRILFYFLRRLVSRLEYNCRCPDGVFVSYPVAFLILRRSFMGHCGSKPDPEKDLMRVYREFGLHQLSPSTLVPTYTCGDERFARSLLYGAGKHFPRPMRCDAPFAAL